MPIICPTILADNVEDYEWQIKKIAHVAHRLQIDLTDGDLAKTKTISPTKAWWPAGMKADIHLMYRYPLKAATAVIKHRPNLIIVHAEAEGMFEDIAKLCGKHQTKIGVALLAPTPPTVIENVLPRLDHVLIFSGVFGGFGGRADFQLLDKVKYLKSLKPDVEVGWDGGVNDQTVAELVYGGVDILNVGGYIQNSDNPAKAFKNLQRIADETGTT
ncbi:TPA: hypothetical protein DIS56_00755 [Candidatus Saccharibacteria bacterium]|nr:MAG: Ribulose-phosphate 3-epimerase [Candidatus Saccharibacteria bacterium GW2011_GWA2_46_10]OGL35018.1 MAG: hypothetical protein A3F05_01655 [Candidatus Saccharibacteria bacterium RIFCSPHIGHO2_12_FULL_47_17]HCM51653.1 hypothetical protein [Candidatus Saccharibacteria bacterium]